MNLHFKSHPTLLKHQKKEWMALKWPKTYLFLSGGQSNQKAGLEFLMWSFCSGSFLFLLTFAIDKQDWIFWGFFCLSIILMMIFLYIQTLILRFSEPLNQNEIIDFKKHAFYLLKTQKIDLIWNEQTLKRIDLFILKQTMQHLEHEHQKLGQQFLNQYFFKN